MSDVFSKIPIDFSKYRELLSDDNPKIPDDQIISDSFKQNQGDNIGSRSAGNLPQNETTEPSTMDKKKIDQQSNNPDQVKAVGNGKISNPKRNIFVMIVLITSINGTIYIYSAYSLSLIHI